MAQSHLKQVLKRPAAAHHRPTVDEKQAAKLSFEQALAKLETIVSAMESGDTPLAQLLAQFEEGNQLLKICEGRLKDAEMKIEQLKQARDGSVTFTSPEAAATEA